MQVSKKAFRNKVSYCKHRRLPDTLGYLVVKQFSLNSIAYKELNKCYRWSLSEQIEISVLLKEKLSEMYLNFKIKRIKIMISSIRQIRY